MSRVASPRQRSSSVFLARVLPGIKPAPFPGFVSPCLASLRSKVPSARGFVHELKLDGYRVQAHLRDGRVRLYTRSGLDWTCRFRKLSPFDSRSAANQNMIAA
jgi:bifunctional non-homologous end joining protein LigD